jgi:putative membrane protein
MSATMSDRNEPRQLDPRWIVYSAVRSLRSLIVPLLIIGFSRRGSLTEWIGIGIAFAVAAVILAGRAVAWTRITYRVTELGIEFASGLLSRNERFLPSDRVQAIDFQEDVIHRLLGVVAIRVESAAGTGAGADITLEALSRDEAERLRTVLLRQPRTDDAGVAPDEAQPPEISVANEEGELVANVPLRRLLIAGATSGRVGPALGLIFGILQFGDDLLFENSWERVVDAAPDATVTFVAVAALVGSVLAWTFAVASTVLVYGNFELRRVENRLQATYGLLERRRVSLPLARIQAVVITEGILRQPFGLAAIRAESAGYGKDSAESGVLMPILWQREISEFLERAVPEFAVVTEGLRLHGPPLRALRRYVQGPVWSMLVVIGLAFAAAVLIDPITWVWGFFALPLVIPAAVLGWLRFRHDGWIVEPDGRVIVRGRPFHLVTTVTAVRRIQHRTLTESPLQRRARLVSFQAAVASGGSGGTVGIAHLDLDNGLRLMELLGTTNVLPLSSVA